MAEESAAPVAAAPAVANPGPQDALRAAAVKALQEGPPKEQPAAAPPAAEAPKDVKAEVADAEKKLAEDMAAKKAAESKTDEAKPPKGWERPFEVLGREKAELRAQQKALKEQQALIEEARALKAAKEAGDPLKVLEANGWAWDDVVAHLTGQKRDPSKAPPAPKVNDELAALRAKVEAMEAEKYQTQMVDSIGKAITSSQFQYVKEMATPQQVMAELQAYYNQHGELPLPGDFDASVKLVLEAAESNLKSMAERFKKVGGLTQPGSPGTVNGAAKGDVSRAGESVVSNTLSNSLDGAPRATTPPTAKPQTPEEYRAAALEALKSGPKR